MVGAQLEVPMGAALAAEIPMAVITAVSPDSKRFVNLKRLAYQGAVIVTAPW
jgi:hypothetical protein